MLPLEFVLHVHVLSQFHDQHLQGLMAHSPVNQNDEQVLHAVSGLTLQANQQCAC